MSKNKFFATTATAALVASAIVPVASAADLKVEDFNDANSIADWAKDSVEYLVAKEAIKGDDKGFFNPQGNLTRAEAATILVGALGLEVDKNAKTTFEDAKNHWASEEIAALQDHNSEIISGYEDGTFRPENQITRQELAKIVVDAYELKLDESAELAFTDNNGWGKEYVEVLASLGIVVGKSETKFAPEAKVTRQEAAAFIHRTEVPSKREEVKTSEAKVISVSAINAKQIVVNFNTKLLGEDDAVTNDATDVANYELDGVAVDAAELSEDGKSVTLTVDAGVEGSDRVLVVSPLATTKEDAEGEVVETKKFSQIISYEDTVAPTVVSTSYEDETITVKFSEEIGTLPSVVRVNGTPVATGVAKGSNANEVVIPFAGLEANTTASLYIAGAKDASEAQNEMALYNGTVIVPAADTNKPHVTNVKVTGQNTAEITLSEAIVADTIAAKLQKGAAINNVTLNKDTDDETGKTYTLTVDLNGDTAGDGIFSATSTSETFSLLIAAEAMTDASSNKNEEFITSLTFVKDTNAPALTKSAVTADNKAFGFTFDESLEVAGTVSNITVKNSDGVKIAVDAATDLKVGDDKVFLVDITSGDVAIAAGTYTVSIPSGFFEDQYGNATSAITATFTVGEASTSDTDKPTAVVTNVDGQKNQFQVAYNEEVTSSALNAGNYKLDGKALPQGTELYFTDTDKDTVVIVLPEGSVNFGNQTDGASAALTIANVTDKAGNAINTKNYTVAVKDNTAATVEAVQVIGQDVYVTFTEAVTFTDSVDANDVFDIKDGETVAAAGNISTVTGNNKQVKFTLTEAIEATLDVDVKDNQTALKDANGVAVK